GWDVPPPPPGSCRPATAGTPCWPRRPRSLPPLPPGDRGWAAADGSEVSRRLPLSPPREVRLSSPLLHDSDEPTLNSCGTPRSAKTMPDEFDELARSLRQGAGREWRGGAAGGEQVTEVQGRRARALVAVARGAKDRGGRVSVAVAGPPLAQA